ncbi:avirulence protein 1b [Phytophthora sojae]|uniref:RxLR effector protein n=3 Tax=Phytophthora sojae TaxID=67593 RepID=G4ZVQ3_PHYSP|nr:avirulence protein 1b [Phytophthora sojae]AEK80499.1 Avh22 [Phytophthora sojae]AEK80500.1 Avh22 [Phytophthora sojae]EGZ11517.1 avirulence protein 1b [Phytophthora sojae]|eukprot:XP_009531850.1 avirulence protein 1b [Phytophthora sojae]
MRLTYIFAVVIAATLQASGTALITTRTLNHAAISNVASADIVHSIDAIEGNGGRMLRKAKEDPAFEEDNEERAGGAFTKWLKHKLEYLKVSAKKRIPRTYENELHRNFRNADFNGRFKRNQAANIRASIN